MHRIQWFDQQIIQGSYPNSAKLASQFEISRRQAQRDIEYMEISLRAPLVYVARHRGYCYEDKAYILPHLYMTEDEKKVLKYLAHRYRHYDYDNSEAIRRVANLLERFTDGEDNGEALRLPVFETDPRKIHHLELLKEAVKQSFIIKLTYTERGAAQHEQVYPLKLVTQVNADYLAAYCPERDMKLMVPLEQILQVVVTEQRFEHTDDPELGGWGSRLPVLKPFRARIVMLHPVLEDTWKGFRILSREELLYEIAFYDTDAFLQHLLVSQWKRLESPQWLKRKLAHLCRQTLQRMQEMEDDENK